MKSVYFLCPECRTRMEANAENDAYDENGLISTVGASIKCPMCGANMVKSFEGGFYNLEYHLKAVEDELKNIRVANRRFIIRREHKTDCETCVHFVEGKCVSPKNSEEKPFVVPRNAGDCVWYNFNEDMEQ